MESYKRTETQEKIIKGMDLVYDRLVAFKKRMNTKMVVLRGDTIVWINPEDL